MYVLIGNAYVRISKGDEGKNGHMYSKLCGLGRMGTNVQQQAARSVARVPKLKVGWLANPRAYSSFAAEGMSISVTLCEHGKFK